MTSLKSLKFWRGIICAAFILSPRRADSFTASFALTGRDLSSALSRVIISHAAHSHFSREIGASSRMVPSQGRTSD